MRRAQAQERRPQKAVLVHTSGSSCASQRASSWYSAASRTVLAAMSAVTALVTHFDSTAARNCAAMREPPVFRSCGRGGSAQLWENARLE